MIHIVRFFKKNYYFKFMPKHIQSQKNIKAIPSLFPFNRTHSVHFGLHEHNCFYIIKWKWHNVTLNSVVYFRCCHIS